MKTFTSKSALLPASLALMMATNASASDDVDLDQLADHLDQQLHQDEQSPPPKMLVRPLPSLATVDSPAAQAAVVDSGPPRQQPTLPADFATMALYAGQHLRQPSNMTDALVSDTCDLLASLGSLDQQADRKFCALKGGK